ncbi:lipopolysaccharide biosynthesis protein [Marinobacter salsuginis]|uniref:lipopolysaccharide biosynthesis protein n=1 Tax=Marinobacter salsuginis TaxID=418719 RepID=UPI00273F6CBF|nr:lipopolysaccharide biosynthesis protein [Marinobacter salsuginis]
MNRHIGVGVLWNLTSLFLSRGASTIFMLFLARFLAPEAFGLVAMSAIAFELTNVFINSGLGSALIRSKTVSDVDYNTVFFTNLLLSLVAYVALFAAAPYIAAFYSQPELTSLIQIMGLVVFINAAKVVQIAILSRKMDFKAQMKANTFGVIVAGLLGVTAAWSGWGVWSLSVQLLTSALVSALVLWMSSQWRPALQFSGESFARLFSFGRNLLAEGMLEILFQNSYVVVIGRFFSAEMTGLYFVAKKLSNLISEQLTGAVQRATFPALSTLQDENAALYYKYRQIMQLMMFLIAPIMSLLAGLAPVLFAILFDSRWSGAVPYLQLLCVVGALYPIHALNVNLLNVKGRSDLVLRIGIFKKAANLTLLFMAIPYGVFGILLSQVLGSVLALLPNIYFSSKLISYSFFEQFFDIVKPQFCALLAGMGASLALQLDFGSATAALLFSGIVGLAIYLSVSLILKSEGAVLLVEKLTAQNINIDEGK